MISEILSDYISKVDYWIRHWNIFGFKKLIIMLDSFSSHWSQKSLRLLKSLEYQIVFLPAYWLQFAQIEMWFSNINQKLKRRIGFSTLNLFSRFCHNEILEIFRFLDKKTVASYVKELYKEQKDCLSLSSYKINKKLHIFELTFKFISYLDFKFIKLN